MDINQLYGFVLALVMIGLILGVGFIVLQEFTDSFVTNTAGCNATARTTCGWAYNSTGSVMSALSDIPTTWLGLIVTIVVVAIVLGIVLRSFTGSKR